MKLRQRFSAGRPGRVLGPALAAAVFVAAYAALAARPDRLYARALDGVFWAGLAYLVAGMGLYTHNIGLFKTFRYWGYRAAAAARRARRAAAFDARPMDLAAFTGQIMSRPKKPAARFLALGLGLLALSALMMLWL